MAKALGITPSTVQGWRKRDVIPENRHEAIVKAAEKKGIELDPALLSASGGDAGTSQAGVEPASTASETAMEVVSTAATSAEAASTDAMTEEASAATAKASDPAQPESAGGSVEETPSASAEAGAEPASPWSSAATAEKEASAAPASKATAPPKKMPDEEQESKIVITPPPPRSGGSGVAMLALVVALAGVASPFWGPMIVGDGDQGRTDEAVEAAGTAAAENAAAIAALRDEIAGVPTTGVDQAVLDRLAALEGAADGAGEELAPARLDALTDQIARLAERVESLETTGSDAGDTGAAIIAVETSVGTVADRLADVSQTLGLLRTRIEALEAVSTADSSLRGAVGDLADRVDGLTAESEAAVARLEALTATVTQETEADVSTQAMMLAVGQLRTALDQGRPYLSPLTTLASLTAGDPSLDEAVTMLFPGSTVGVKTRDRLGSEFPNVSRSIVEAATVGDDAPIHLRVWAALSGLVNVRPAPGEVEGTDPLAILATAEGRLLQDDLGGAIQALSGLEGRPLATAAVWIAEAQQRLDAEDALDRLADATIGRLAVPPVAVGGEG